MTYRFVSASPWLLAGLLLTGTTIAQRLPELPAQSAPVKTQPAAAQDGLVRTPVPVVHATRQPMGAQFRDANDRAQTAMQSSDFNAARTLLQPTLAYCDRLGGVGRTLVSVTNADEYQSFMASRTDTTPVDWIDMACPEAYKMRG